MAASSAKFVMHQCKIVWVINIYVTHGKKIHTKKKLLQESQTRGNKTEGKSGYGWKQKEKFSNDNATYYYYY